MKAIIVRKGITQSYVATTGTPTVQQPKPSRPRNLQRDKFIGGCF